jgi:hypothetical protein
MLVRRSVELDLAIPTAPLPLHRPLRLQLLHRQQVPLHPRALSIHAVTSTRTRFRSISDVVTLAPPSVSVDHAIPTALPQPRLLRRLRLGLPSPARPRPPPPQLIPVRTTTRTLSLNIDNVLVDVRHTATMVIVRLTARRLLHPVSTPLVHQVPLLLRLPIHFPQMSAQSRPNHRPLLNLPIPATRRGRTSRPLLPNWVKH